jgi:hypothetical protein
MSVLFIPVMLLFCFGVGRYELNPVLRYCLAAAGSMLLAGISAFFTLMDGKLIPELAYGAVVAAPIVGCLVAAGSHAMARREAAEELERTEASGYRPARSLSSLRDAAGSVEGAGGVERARDGR